MIDGDDEILSMVEFLCECEDDPICAWLELLKQIESCESAEQSIKESVRKLVLFVLFLWASQPENFDPGQV